MATKRNSEDIDSKLDGETVTPSEPVKSETDPVDDKTVKATYENEINTLVANLRRDNYLPVIFVGAAGAGKTQVFTSLMKFFKSADETRNPNACNVVLGKPLVGIDTAYGKTRREYAERHFRVVADNALNGKAESATNITLPFAIPVCLTAQIDGKVLLQNFAFFEANGEWFHTAEEGDGKEYYPKLKQEIARIFQVFDGDMGVAIIYTAPCDVVSNATEELENQEYLKRLSKADKALQVGLTRYMETRVRKDKDKHIFLLTKWDAAKKIQGFADRIKLNNMDQHKILSLSATESLKLAGNVANNLYPASYGVFRSAALVENQRQRVFMPFSAGIFTGQYIANPNESDKFDRYIKSLWNELMFTAGHAQYLFPPPPPVVVPWWKKILNFFG